MDLPTDIFLWKEESDKVNPVSIFIYHFCRDSVEILAVKIRDNGDIQGFRVGQETLKLSSIADDVICFLKNKSSFDAEFDRIWRIFRFKKQPWENENVSSRETYPMEFSIVSFGMGKIKLRVMHWYPTLKTADYKNVRYRMFDKCKKNNWY